MVGHMTQTWWTDYWWWWLLAVAVSWLVMELVSIAYAHLTGQKNIATWTLSDTIRRWSSRFKWLAPLVVGVCAMLIWHFFAQSN